MEFGVAWEDKFDLLARVEERFGVPTRPEEVLRLHAVDDLLHFVCQRLPSARADEESVWPELRGLVADHLGVRPEDVERSTRFYEDLNCGGPLGNGLPYRPWIERHTILVGLLLGAIAAALSIYLNHER